MIETLNIKTNLVPESRIKEVDFENLKFGRTFSDHMFVAHYENGQWSDLSIQPYANLNLSPALLALHYGQSIFEGMKAYRNIQNEVVLFRPFDNIRRLNQSAERMCMAQINEDIFINALHQLVELDQEWVPRLADSSLYIRPFMFASDEYIGMRPSDNYTFIIFTCPVASYYGGSVKVKIEKHYVRATNGGTGYAKTAGNYAASLYPARLAQQQGYDQLIWTDSKEHKYIEESGTMNLMFVINDTLITAPIGDTILDGVTRKSVLQIAKHWSYPVEERAISVDELIEAIEKGQLQEAFGVGTAATVTPISLIAHEDMEYELPEVREAGFGQKVKKQLKDICMGRAEDTFNWIYKVV